MVQRLTEKLREVFGIDVRCLAIFRIVIALIILADLALRSRFIVENYTDDGFLPRGLVRGPDCYMSLQMLDGSYAFQVAHFVVAGIAGLMLLVGYRTRIATVICWLLTMSLHARNSYLLDAGDDLLRSLLLWSLFLPLGLRYSIDSRGEGNRKEAVILSPATVALMLQFACVYFFAGWFKSGPEWASGTAIELVLRQTLWTQPAGDALRQYPDLLGYLTPTVVWFEIIAPLCLFIPVQTRRIRMFVVPAFWMFQLGLATTIQLHIFPLITAAATVPFLSSVIWSAANNSKTEANVVTAVRRRVTKYGRVVWCTTLAVLALAMILGQAANFGKSLYPTAERVASLVGWNAIWSMYATVSAVPYELSAEATLANDDIIDLVKTESSSGDRWRVQQLHRSYRFKYFLETAIETGPEIPKRYLILLVQCWNQTQSADRIARRARILISTQPINSPGPSETSVVAEMGFVVTGQ